MLLDKYVLLNKDTLEVTIPVKNVSTLCCSEFSETAQSRICVSTQNMTTELMWVFAESAWPMPPGWFTPQPVFLITVSNFQFIWTSSVLLYPCWTLQPFFHSTHVLKPGFTYKSCSTLHTQLLKHLRNLNKSKCCPIVGLESTNKRDKPWYFLTFKLILFPCRFQFCHTIKLAYQYWNTMWSFPSQAEQNHF